MPQLPIPETSPQQQKKWPKRLGKGILLSGAAALLLSIGWAYGQGKLSWHGFNSEKSDTAQSIDYSSLDEVYKTLKSRYDGKLDSEAVMDGLKKGLAQATGDPYTEYLTPEEAKEFDEGLSGSFTGIGAELGKEDDNIIIVSPISGFPAEQAGLKPKDIIVAINDETVNDISLSEAVKRIRGPKDTTVKLKVVRDGKPLDFEIKRDNITIPSVESKILEGNIGYLKISRFAEDTSSLSKKAAQEFKQAGVKGVILDVRGDPGGLLDTAVDVSSLWLPSGDTVLQEKRDNVVIKTYKSTGNDILEGIPTVVLIDEGSASASEIVAGALKDNGAATLMGAKTFGKGSVQQLERLPGGGVLKVTIARWYTPNGRNIDKEGIEPDQAVKISDEEAEAKKDPQKDAAINYIKTR